MNVHIRRALVLSTLTLVAAGVACTGRTDDERDGRLASALRKIDPGGDPGPSDPPDPSDPPGGGGGHHVRDAGGGATVTEPDAAPFTEPDAATAPPQGCATSRYFVWIAGAECTDVPLDGGTWVGEPVFPGHASGHCAYRWTGSSLPDAIALHALDDIALALYRLPPVVADCTALPSSCDANDATCAAAEAAVGAGKCPVSHPGCGPGIIISCDSCAVAEEDTLYAVIDPSLVSAPTLVGHNESDTISFAFTPPTGAQRFAIPIPPGILGNGEVVRFDTR
jgi:hypothetical protein